MRHLREERLLAVALELEPSPAHVAACGPCAARLEELRRELASLTPPPCPEPPSTLAGLNERVFAALAREQAAARGRNRRRAWGWRPAWAAAAVALGLTAGLWHLAPRRPAPAAPATAPAPATTLAPDVVRHIDRAQALLIEFKHAADNDPEVVHVELEASTARDLLASNRVYEQDAVRRGDLRTAHLLALLEPALLQIAHAPAALPADRWHQLQADLASSGVLFKVRVVDQTLDRNGDL